MKLYPEQNIYAKQVLLQVKKNGVALLQLPTGKGKTIITLKVIAELLKGAKQPRPVILVSRKRQDAYLFEQALHGKIAVQDGRCDDPWVRDAASLKGISHLCRGRKPKIGKVDCRSAQGLNFNFPPSALVIVDEVHRFPSFLKKMAQGAYNDKGGPKTSHAKQRQFILLSATPINPTKISESEEKGELTFEEQEKLEDKSIKTSYLNLYKAMIALSTLSRREKNNLLEKLDDGAKSNLELFASDLLKVMQILRPVPSPKVLLSLGPKGKVPYRPNIKKAVPAVYAKSINGLLKFHEAIAKQHVSLYYCAERMALAGGKSSPGKISVGFQRFSKAFARKGLFHYQPSAPYMHQTLNSLRVLDRSRNEIRNLLSGKIDTLYDFLISTLRKRASNRKWRVLVYCAHKGSVASLAAELERRFASGGASCKCSEVETGVYGNNGGKRIVWDTEGYADNTMNDSEEITIQRFGERSGGKQCNIKFDRCPRGFILVTSDRLSESIDLHNCCEIMVHFDLDWSPLRMIQRFGRLWRIDRNDKSQGKIINPPAAFHMIQPGSVDEEIFWRLENRWERLGKLQLGLEAVKLKDALGRRIY